MYCKKCGAQLAQGVSFCGNCGTQNEAAQAQPPQPPQPPPQGYPPPPPPGYPPQPPPGYPPQQYSQPQSGMLHPASSSGKTKAKVGMALGIASLLFPLFSWITVSSAAAGSFMGSAVLDPSTYSTAATVAGIGLVAAIVGLILSTMGRKELKLIGQPGGMAVAGLVCSIIGIVFCFSCTTCYACACQELNNAYGQVGGFLDGLFN